MVDWSRFDNIVTAEEVVEAKAKFTPIEEGVYQAKIEKMEASQSNSGLPMLKVQYRTTTNRVVFSNQLVQGMEEWQTVRNVAEVTDFVEKVSGADYEFTTVGQLGVDIEALSPTDTYDIKITYGKKDTEHNFPNVKILGVSETEEELPF